MVPKVFHHCGPKNISSFWFQKYFIWYQKWFFVPSVGGEVVDVHHVVDCVVHCLHQLLFPLMLQPNAASCSVMNRVHVNCTEEDLWSHPSYKHGTSGLTREWYYFRLARRLNIRPDCHLLTWNTFVFVSEGSDPNGVSCIRLWKYIEQWEMFRYHTFADFCRHKSFLTKNLQSIYRVWNIQLCEKYRDFW